MKVWTKQGDEVQISKCDLPLFLAHTWAVNRTNGYLVRTGPRPQQKKSYFHREVMNAPSGMEVDHKFHDKLDNRRSKLRLVSHSGNGLNREGATRASTTRVRGVHETWDGQFSVRFVVRGKVFYLGRFRTIQKAIPVAKRWLRQRGLAA